MMTKTSTTSFQTEHMQGMTAEEYARWLDEHEDEESWGPPIEVAISPNLTSVISVRFNKGELGQVATAAAEAGLKPSTFIRQLVLGYVNSPAPKQATERSLIRERATAQTANESFYSYLEKALEAHGDLASMLTATPNLWKLMRMGAVSVSRSSNSGSKAVQSGPVKKAPPKASTKKTGAQTDAKKTDGGMKSAVSKADARVATTKRSAKTK